MFYNDFSSHFVYYPAFDYQNNLKWRITISDIIPEANKLMKWIKPRSETLSINDELLIVNYGRKGLISVHKEGRILWHRFDLNMSTYTKFDDKIYGYNEEEVCKIDPYTGEIIQSRNIKKEMDAFGYKISTPFWVIGDYIFIPSDNDSINLLLIDRKTLKVIDMLQIEPHLFMRIVPMAESGLLYHNNQIFYSDSSKTLVVFDMPKSIINRGVLNGTTNEYKEFLTTISTIDKKIYFELQNYIFYFEAIKYDTLDLEKDIEDKNKRLRGYDFSRFEGDPIDKNTVFKIFTSLESSLGDVEISIISDISGRIFIHKIYPNSDDEIIEIADSILDLLGSDYSNNLKPVKEDALLISNIKSLSEVMDEKRIYKFDISGWCTECYEELLNKVFEGSKLELQDYYVVKQLQLEEDKRIVVLRFADFTQEIVVEDGKWFDFNLANEINKGFRENNIDFRISLVHQNNWDQIHGLVLTSFDEYKLLKQQNFIINAR